MRAVIAATAGMALLLGMMAGQAQAHTHGDRTDRAPEPGERPSQIPVAGQDRFATAAQAATDAFEHAESVVLATGGDFADALAGSTLGGAVDAPVLLTPGQLTNGQLPESLTDALDQLDPDTIYLLGGERAIGEDVADYLEAHADATAIERVRGASRFETALEIARMAADQDAAAGVIDIGGETVTAAFLGTGLDFPDSVAAGPGAFAEAAPMLLTAPDQLHPAAQAALEELDIDHVFALGGSAAVSDDVVAELQERGISVERLAGANRWETAAAIAERLEGDGFGFDAAHVGLATAHQFADALAATSYLGSAQAPLLLADADADGNLIGPAADYLQARGCEIGFLHIIGGHAAIGGDMRQAAQDFAQCVSDDAPDDGEDAPDDGDQRPDEGGQVPDDGAPEDGQADNGAPQEGDADAGEEGSE